ncbi:HNH endonuclease [Salmonella enterica]|uniref:HNH endonuclease n=3 Tax=Salmonella enterica TaxID=28901 RepID=A0A5J1F2T8_SALET|nr:HNH endonuclease [Salmonella enterica]EAA1361122.1 HNH endonuclease [Salmonella enterica subsp. enterica serovar Braenderup]EBV7936340.1 HNH endonuclease [Salmonella enterica subsp. enterica serovar Oslo]EBX2337441.1 HNH endonuclease [Salmonella enterica subsp. enterica serovar Bareilly]ECN8562297.1 HNH endonuclease [Salmonella enterica subsp. enterica serovar Brandenburg]EDW2221308.1 HNH endonuclease [Salmonella enterica subsp. enterica serovar Lingwala]
MNSADLSKILEYDPSTGVFRWNKSKGTALAGDVAGSVNHHGYREITIDGKKLQANRLAWLFVTGMFPNGVIDHINRVRDDNRFSNLRDISVAENNLNKSIRLDNKSGTSGVNWDIKREKWRATGQINRKQKHLGYFKNIDDAMEARRIFCRKYHLTSKEYADEVTG